jgi:hypothetical protein
MAESGTIAPLLTVAGAVVAAEEVARPAALENGVDDVAAAGVPVRVPEDMAAAVVDSPEAAATAARLAPTLTVFEAVDVVGVADEIELEDVVLEVTSWPAEVGKTAAAPERAEVGTGAVVAAAGVVVEAAVAVVPRVGTDAGAPVTVLALM